MLFTKAIYNEKQQFQAISASSGPTFRQTKLNYRYSNKNSSLYNFEASSLPHANAQKSKISFKKNTLTSCCRK